MAVLLVRPYTKHRNWEDIRKFHGQFDSYLYEDVDIPYSLTHRIEYATSAAAGAGNPLDPIGVYVAIRNLSTTDTVLLYCNTLLNWPNPAIEISILPGHWIEIVDLDPAEQPSIRVDSALSANQAECEVLQIGIPVWEEEEPDFYCDAWAVGHTIQDGVGTKHFPEGGIWATVASTITDDEHWLADVAGVTVADYWAVGYERDVGIPIAGLFSFYNGAAWAEVAVAGDPPQYGVWGFATDDYWSVGGPAGGDGEIWHYNGVVWTQNCVPDVEGNRTLYCVHGNAPAHVYAAGASGLVCEWTGAAWAVSTVPAEMLEWHFYGTWTSATPNTWVCGGDQAWWNFSGGNGVIYIELPVAPWWQGYILPQDCPTLRAMWGFADNDIWAVGDQGWILHFNGFAWTRVAEPAGLLGNYDYRGVFGCWPWSVWAIGTGGGSSNVIIHWDGLQWTIVHGPNAAEMDLLGLKGVEVVAP